MTSPFDRIAAVLTERARRLAAARAEARRTDPAQRWRKAALVWPLFVKD